MNNFRSAKDIYFKRLGLADRPGPSNQIDHSNSIYARDARLGLCMKCHYEGTDDVNRRPISRAMPYCEYCMIDFSIGTEKIERKNRLEVKLWFKD